MIILCSNRLVRPYTNTKLNILWDVRSEEKCSYALPVLQWGVWGSTSSLVILFQKRDLVSIIPTKTL